MLSNAVLMKSANCISTTGRSPMIAMPTAMPVNPSSARGVFITRFGPNSAASPLVALNAPPNSPPTSSPNTSTSGSRRISSASASVMAAM